MCVEICVFVIRFGQCRIRIAESPTNLSEWSEQPNGFEKGIDAVWRMHTEFQALELKSVHSGGSFVELWVFGRILNLN